MQIPDGNHWAHVTFEKDAKRSLDATLGVIGSRDAQNELHFVGTCFLVHLSGEWGICVTASSVLRSALGVAAPPHIRAHETYEWSDAERAEVSSNLRIIFPIEAAERSREIGGWSMAGNIAWIRVNLPGRGCGPALGILAVDSDLHPIGKNLICLGASIKSNPRMDSSGKSMTELQVMFEARAGRIAAPGVFVGRSQEGYSIRTGVAVQKTMWGGPVLTYQENSNKPFAALGVVFHGQGDHDCNCTENFGNTLIAPIGFEYGTPIPLPDGSAPILRDFVGKAGVVDIGRRRKKIRVEMMTGCPNKVSLPRPLEDVVDEVDGRRLTAAEGQGQWRRLCEFCAVRTGNSNEHVFSDWTAEVIGKTELWHFHLQSKIRVESGRPITIAKTVDDFQGDVLSKTTKGVCVECNNNWMSEIENSVKPIATPLMNGDSVVLAPGDRTTLAQWTTLKVLVLELAFPSKRSFPLSVYRKFYEDRSVLAGGRIYVGRYLGTMNSPAYRAFSRLSENCEGTAELHTLLSFLLWKQLLIVHIWTASPPSSFHFSKAIDRCLFPLVPLSSHSMRCPPEAGIDDAAFEALVDSFSLWSL